MKADSPLMDSWMSSNALPLALFNKVDSPGAMHTPVAAFSFGGPKVRPPSFTQFLFICDVGIPSIKIFAVRTFIELTSVGAWLIKLAHFFTSWTYQRSCCGWIQCRSHYWKLCLTDSATN